MYQTEEARRAKSEAFCSCHKSVKQHRTSTFEMRSTTEHELHYKDFLPRIYDIGMMAWAELDWHGHESHHSVDCTKTKICKKKRCWYHSNPNVDNSVTRNISKPWSTFAVYSHAKIACAEGWMHWQKQSDGC